MNKHLLAAITVTCILICNVGKAQLPIAYYDFESNAARNTTIETTVQESITGIGSPSITATSLTSADGIGNGATYTGTNTGYALGYFGFTSNASTTSTDANIKLGPFNCTGFSTLTIAMDVQGVGTQAPDNVDIYWSSNDITYTRINATTVVANGTWNTRTFTVPAGADGAATLYFKVIGYNGGATPTAGNGEMKIDNFTLRSSQFTASNTLISRTSHGIGLSSGGTFLPTYASLNVNGASINVTASSDIVFTGTLTLTNGNFVMNNDSLAFQTGNIPIARNGTTQTGNIGMGLLSKLVFGRPGNVGGNAFTIPNDVFSTSSLNITSLTIQHTNAITLNNQDISLLGNLNLTSGTLNDGGRTISLTLGNITGTGTHTGSGLIVMTGIGATISGATLLNLQLNNIVGFSLTGSPAIAGTLTLTNGALAVGANTLTFRTSNTPIVKSGGTITVSNTSSLIFGTAGNLGGNAFTIPNDLFTSSPSFNNLTLNRTNSITIGNQPFTINGTMTLTAGVFDALNTTLTFQTGNTPLARTNGTLTLGSTANLVFGTPGNLGGNAFTIPASMFTSNPSINSLTVNRTNALILNTQILTLDGTLNLTAGAFSIGSGSLVLQTAAAPIVRTSGTITVTASSSLTFGTQASALSIPDGTFTAAPSLGNLTINRAGGVTVGNQAFTINGTLTLTTGVFDILNTAIVFQTGATPIARTSGTLTVGSATNITFGANAGAFTIPDDVFTTAPAITSLTINRAGGVTIGNQAFTLNGTLTLTTGVFDVLNTTLTFQTGNTPIARTNGTVTLGSTANLVFGTAGNQGGNAFTIPANTFTTPPSINSLTVDRTNTLTWNAQTLTLDGTLTLIAGAFSIGSGGLVLQTTATPIVRTAGTITVTTSSSLTFGTQASAFTIPDNTFTAAPSLGNLTIDRAGGVTVGNQAFIINGTLTLTTGVFDILNTAIVFQTGATPIVKTAGTLTVGSSSNITFGTNAGLFTIPDNTFTTAPSFNALTINRAGGITLGNQDMTLAGTLTLTAGTLNDNGRTITVAGNIAGTATHASTGTGEILMTSSGATIAAVRLGNIELNNAGGFSFVGAATINGTLILTNGAVSLGAFAQTFQNANVPISSTGGTITTLTTSSLVFGTAGNTGGNSFTLPSNLFTSAPTMSGFTVNRTNPLILSNQSITLTGILTLAAGEFDLAANNITFQTGNTPIVRTAGTLTTSTSTNLIFGTAGNVGGSAFAIPNSTFTSSPTPLNNFTVQRTNALTLGDQDIILAGSLNLTAGTLNDNGTTITVGTNITGTGTESGTGLVLMTGSGGTISGATLSNLQLNNAGGFSLTGSPTIAGTLTLTAGALTIGANTLTFRTADVPLARTAGTITVSTTSNFIFGTAGNLGGNPFIIPDNIFTTAPSINNFTINRTNSLTLGNQALTLNGSLTLTAGVLDILNTTLTFQGTGSQIVRNGTSQLGTITAGSASSLFFGGTGNSTIPNNAFTAAPSISNLTVNRTNTLTWNNQSLTLDGTLALDAGIFSIGAITLSFQNNATPITRAAGTLTVATTSGISFGIQATLFTIPDGMFTAATPSLGDLTINRAGGVTAGNQGFIINGTLTLTTGVLDILNNAISFLGTTAIARTTGTLTVGSTTNITFGTNAAAFTIPNNTFTTAPTIGALIINRAGGITVGNQNFTLNGALTLTNGAFDILGTTLTLQGAGSTIARNGTSQTGTLTVGSTSNLHFGGTGNNIIPSNAFTTAPSLNDMTVNRTNTLTWGNQALTINGILALDAGVFTIGNNTLTLQNGNTPLTRTTGTLTVGATTNIVFGTAGNTGGTAFTIPNGFFTATPPSFGSFTINRTNPLTLNSTQGFTLSGDLNLIGGTLDNAGRAITMTAGNITGAGTETGAGIISMTASGATISGATISNLTLNNAGGFSLTGSPSFTNTLTLTNGVLAVGANTLTFHTGNTPIARTAGTITLASTSSLAFGAIGNLGGAAFTIPANTFTAAPEFTNFAVNRTNSLTLNSQDFALTGLFTLTAGQLILPTNYTFTLRSTSITNTALVDVVGTTGVITYNSGAAFKVERFIPQTGGGIRAYRDVAPSVNTGTRKIFDTWQEGGTNGLDNGINYGTHVAGKAGASPGGIDATTGFDITGSGAASLYSDNISLVTGADSFDPITSTNQTNDTLSAFKGYRILIRGNRLVNLYQSPTPTTMNAPAILRSTGTLVTGTVTFTTTGTSAMGGTNTGVRMNSATSSATTAGFTMIGNPYASPVVWDSLVANSTSLEPTYWLFDPNIGTTGSYVTYNTLTGSNNIASGATKYIQPGQGFFVQNSSLSPAPQLVFMERHKAPSIANLTLVYRTTNTSNLSKINISVKRPVTNRGIITADGTAIAYGNSFSNAISQEDGIKFSNNGENIAINSNGKQLSIEGRKLPTITDTISLRLWQVTAGVSYQLEINTTEFADNGLQAYLLDRFNSSQTILTMNGIKSYPFTTTADTNSYNNRFKIVFKTNSTVPINFTSIKASAYNKGVNVEWSAAENNVSNYQVQRSADGANFTAIGATNAKGNGSSSMQQYLWYDAAPFANHNYYRIMSTDLSGAIKYSSTVLVNLTGKKESITVYPNPVKGKTINLQLSNVESGDYKIVLYNLNGQSIFNSRINVASNALSQNIALPQATPAGTYMLNISKGEFSYKLKVIVQ